jgi:hypothetical protein
MLNNNLESVHNQREDLKDQLLADLPPAGSMKQKAINLCLDNIRNGIDPDHYREVLRKLSQIL